MGTLGITNEVPANSMTTKQHLHHLVDLLPNDTWGEAERMLESLTGSSVGPEDAPIDDEPVSEAERAAVRRAHKAIERGEVVRDEDLERELNG
jgi:hypothetical protein